MTVIYRGLLFAAIVAISACTFDGGNSGGAGPDGSLIDSGVADLDASTTGSDGGIPDGMVPPDSSVPCAFDNTAICASGPPMGEVTVSTDEVFNTDTDTRCRNFTQSDTTPGCLVYTDLFTVQSGNTLRVIGSRILLVASLSDIVIDGDVDFGSKRATGKSLESLGAGSPSSLCVPGSIAEDDIGGAGGGSGGSYQHSGGAGGTGDTNQNGGNNGNAAGSVAGPTTVPTTIRAGCAGTAGGSESLSQGGGRGGRSGASGGAAGFVAIDTFSLGSSGRILASGAGAIGGGRQSGGGGGGSGGMVYIEAATVSLDGTIAAEGGGGGGGGVATVSNSAAGDPGQDATLSQDGSGGDGGSFFIPGSGTFAGGDGGDGANILNANGSPGISDSGGAGGGGGGAGYIVVVSDSLEAPGVFSPDITER